MKKPSIISVKSEFQNIPMASSLVPVKHYQSKAENDDEPDETEEPDREEPLIPPAEPPSYPPPEEPTRIPEEPPFMPLREEPLISPVEIPPLPPESPNNIISARRCKQFYFNMCRARNAQQTG